MLRRGAIEDEGMDFRAGAEAAGAVEALAA
jgi:hypothetical protein